MSERKNKKDKLAPEHKILIFNLLGSGYKQKAVVERILTMTGVKITVDAVGYYKRKYPEKILEAAKRWEARLECVELTDQIRRLLIRQDMVYDLIKPENMWHKEMTAYGERWKGNHLAVNKILDSMHEEIDGKRLALTGAKANENPTITMLHKFVVNIENKTNDEIEEFINKCIFETRRINLTKFLGEG